MTTKDLCLDHVLKPSRLTSGKAPAIIMLHGYGSDENDLFSFAPELDDDYLIVSAKAPIKMMPFGNAWYDINFDANQNKFTNDEQAVESCDLIVQFIDEVVENYNANPKKITLLGFSQGAILSYAVALSYPEKISQVVAMSGYVHQPILKKGYENNDFSKLRFYCSHGSVDQVVPVDWDRKTKPFLDNLKIENTYSEFPVGHGVNPDNFSEMKAWLK